MAASAVLERMQLKIASSKQMTRTGKAEEEEMKGELGSLVGRWGQWPRGMSFASVAKGILPVPPTASVEDLVAGTTNSIATGEILEFVVWSQLTRVLSVSSLVPLKMLCQHRK